MTGAAALIDEGDRASRQGSWSEAVEKYTAAIVAEPDNAIARLCRGLALVRLGRRAEARDDLVAALATPHEVHRVAARFVLGQMAMDDGAPREAVRQLERALHECSWTTNAATAARVLARAWTELGRPDVAGALERWASRSQRR